MVPCSSLSLSLLSFLFLLPVFFSCPSSVESTVFPFYLAQQKHTWQFCPQTMAWRILQVPAMGTRPGNLQSDMHAKGWQSVHIQPGRLGTAIVAGGILSPTLHWNHRGADWRLNGPALARAVTSCPEAGADRSELR